MVGAALGQSPYVLCDTNVRKSGVYFPAVSAAMLGVCLLAIALLINYNLRIINSKIRLFEAALERPEFNVSQKLGGIPTWDWGSGNRAHGTRACSRNGGSISF